MRYYCLIPLIVLLMSNNCFSQKYIWARVYLGNTGKNHIVGIDNVDSLNIMAADVSNDYPPPGYNLVLKSTDAGINWDTVYKGLIFKDSLIKAKTISYPTKDFCIVGCWKNYYIKSTDGGKSWTSNKLTGIRDYYPILGISMLDDKHGIMSNFTDLVISHDGFNTYTKVEPPLNCFYRAVQIINKKTIYTAIQDKSKNEHEINQYFYKTSDEGETWEELFKFKYQYFMTEDIHFLDSLYGYIVGYQQKSIGEIVRNVIYKTTDGGNNWRLVLDTIVPWNAWGLQEIDVLDRNTAIATSQFGVVYWTHDGGESWQLDSNAILREGIPATLYPCILGKHTALIADFNDRITRSYLNPLDIDDFKQSDKMELIYPNPATDFITINLQPSEGLKPSEGSVVEIFDMLGVKVISEPIHPMTSSHRMNVKRLPVGLYFVKIADKVEKFVKM